MKKLICLAAAVGIVGALGWLPADRRDVGKLLPARALIVSAEEGQVSVNGGESLSGRGDSWSSALEDLRNAAPGEAFLGACGHVILLGDAEAILPDILQDQELRPAARVYRGQGEMKPDEAAEYLDAHEAGVTMQRLQAAVLEERPSTLPLLVCRDGRYHLEK